MLRPDPLRPPAPVGARPRPPRSRRWILAAVLGLVSIGLPTALLLIRSRADRPPMPEEVSDRFVHAVAAGSAPESGPDSRTGFETAYGLLTAEKRASLPFDVFFEDWRRLSDARGFIVDSVRTSEVGTEREREIERRARRPADLSYLLFLGGENQEHATLDTVELRLTMIWNKPGVRYEIADYVRKNVPNPRASR